MNVESYKATLVELQNKNMELEKSIKKKKKKVERWQSLII